MLLTVTPSLKEAEAEKMRPLRYHTTRGGGLPEKYNKYTVYQYLTRNYYFSTVFFANYQLLL